MSNLEISHSKATLGFLSLGAVLLLFLALKGLFGQFASLFPAGLYRYSALVFSVGTLFVWGMIAIRPVRALFMLILLMPFAARLSEYWVLEVDSLVVTLDVISIWVSAIISISIYKGKRDVMWVFFILFLALVSVSSAVSGNSGALTIILCGIVTPFLVYTLTTTHLRELGHARTLVNALALLTVVISAFAFAQPIISGDVADYFYLRLPSVFYNPVIFANVIVLLWPFILISGPRSGGGSTRLVYAVKVLAVFAALGALLLTGSRGALLICSLQLVWLYRRFYRAGQKTTRFNQYSTYFIVGILLMVMLAYSETLFSTVFRRFSYIDFHEQGNSAYERILGFMGGVELGVNNPLLGVGLGNFRDEYAYTIAAASGQLELESAHNFILNLFAETGFLGLIIWVCILWQAFRRLRMSCAWLRSKGAHDVSVVLLASFMGYTATQALFYGEFLHKNVGLPTTLYFLVMGIITSINSMRLREN